MPVDVLPRETDRVTDVVRMELDVLVVAEVLPRRRYPGAQQSEAPLEAEVCVAYVVEDVEFHPYDVGHPIRLAREDVDRHLADLEVLLRKDLSREEGRDPRLHYATLIYACCVPTR